MIPYKVELAENATFPISGADPEHPELPVWVTYEQFVCNLVRDRGEESKNLEHMIIGIAGEAGEVADCIKKHTIYGKELDRKNAVEELGDLEFYMAGLRQMLGITRYETLTANVSKLQARYKNGYSDAAAIVRADKEPAPVVIDVTAPAYVAEIAVPAVPQISQEQVDEVDEQAGVVQEWCVPLLQAYHAGKTVQAISYSKHTATVLFVGDSNPYKLYKPKGEQ